MTIQPDLFGDYDRQQDQQRLWSEPATCPCCGTTEPTGYLLQNNHGVTPGTGGSICGFPPGRHPIYGKRCVAQDLVTSHIAYSTRRLAAAATDTERQQATGQLDRDINRGRALGLDVDAIRASAQPPPSDQTTRRQPA